MEICFCDSLALLIAADLKRNGSPKAVQEILPFQNDFFLRFAHAFVLTDYSVFSLLISCLVSLINQMANSSSLPWLGEKITGMLLAKVAASDYSVLTLGVSVVIDVLFES